MTVLGVRATGVQGSTNQMSEVAQEQTLGKIPPYGHQRKTTFKGEEKGTQEIPKMEMFRKVGRKPSDYCMVRNNAEPLARCPGEPQVCTGAGMSREMMDKA